MDPMDTLFKKNNIAFYVLLMKRTQVKSAAKAAGLCTQHGTRLVSKWRNAGWIEKGGLIYRYRYTAKGKEIKRLFDKMEWFYD